MKLAFYVGGKGNLFDKAICFATRGPFSHVEIVFDPGTAPAKPIDEHDPNGSLCFSSSSRAPRNGCGFQRINLSDGKWTLRDLTVQPADAAAILDMACADVGRKYDWQGIWGFVLPLVPDNKQERFCSEEVVLLLQRAGLLKELHAVKTSPNDLARCLGVK